MASRVVAVEVDDVLADQLPKTVADRAPELASKLELVHADAMHLEKLPGPPPTALVANLPYNISVPVLLHFLERFDSLTYGAGDGAGRGRAPARRRARVAHLRHPEPQGALVGRRRARRQHRTLGVLAGSQRRLGPRGSAPTRAAGRRPNCGRERSRWWTPRSPSAARRCAPRWRPRSARPAAAEAALRSAGIDPGARGEQLTIADFARLARGLPSARVAG